MGHSQAFSAIFPPKDQRQKFRVTASVISHHSGNQHSSSSAVAQADMTTFQVLESTHHPLSIVLIPGKRPPPLGAKSLKGQQRWASPESEPSPTPHSAHAGPKIPCPLPGSAQACSLPVSLPQTPGTSKGQLFAGHVDRVGMSIYICICICICLGST